ncbi:histone H1-like [Petromyzon marinus]|uniref:Histone H1.5-like n=1 Tax=Petromyzon marinus TaxID=7757 RepID=A0AAJ7X4B8_PETMA|nr:histone H1.5-like [Petromyzon marinus]
MAETAPAQPPAAATSALKSPKKKRTAPKAKKVGPSVSELILKALASSKERNGVSLPALKKSLAAGGYDVEKNNARVKLAIKKLVAKDAVAQVKGSGASGSFKLNKKEKAAAKAKPKSSTAKPAAKKPAAAKKVKKPAAAKKTAPKKSPKKAKKSAAAKSPKKVKSAVKPKKAAKSPAKPKAAKPKVAKPKTVKAKATKPKVAKPKKAVAKPKKTALKK